MRLPFLIVFLLVCSTSLHAQTPDSALTDITYYNFGFEVLNKNEVVPDGWFNFNPQNRFSIQSDSLIRHSGRRSVLLTISNNDSTGHAGIAYALPARYTGDELTLKAWLRHENVTSFVSLFISLTDSTGKEIQAATLDDRMINGTRDWRLYDLKIPLQTNTKTIYIGANIKGPGKLWLDDVQLLIDGTDISQARVKED